MNNMIKAYAKTNLSLDIVGVRSDGYHLLSSVMQTVDIYDEISVSLNDTGKIEVLTENKELLNENNICFLSAKKFLTETGLKKGVKIEIKKNIPVAAGMGGGSSDAAAVLKALNEMTNNPLSKEKLLKLALTLGADVPFFIEGSTALIEGIGEIKKIIYNPIEYAFLFVKNSQKLSTKEMYKKLDEKEISTTDYTSGLLRAIENNSYDEFVNSINNVFSNVWNYENIKAKLKADAVCISGSGPSVFGIYKTYDDAKKAEERLKGEFDFVKAAKPVSTIFR